MGGGGRGAEEGLDYRGGTSDAPLVPSDTMQTF